MKGFPLNRRRFLRGVGGVTLSLPFLEVLAPKLSAQASNRPKRIIAVVYTQGFPNHPWKPTGPDGNLTLPYITAPLEPIKHKCLFISESYRGVTEMHGTFKYGHDGKKESALTSTLPAGAFRAGSNTNHIDDVILSGLDRDDYRNSGANSESIETAVGRAIRHSGHSRSAVNLAIASQRNGYGYEADTNMCWEGRGARVTCEYNPVKAFDDLFGGLVGGDDGPNAELQRLRTLNQSALDAVLENLNALKRDLGRDDRERLEAHADRVRDIELGIEYAATCSAPVFGAELPSLTQNAGENDRRYMDRLFGESTPGIEGAVSAPQTRTAPLQAKLLAHAMACDIAPVGRLAFTSGGSGYFGIPLVDNEIGYYGSKQFHPVCHTSGNVNSRTGKPSRPSQGGPGYYAPELLDGFRHYYEVFADLLLELDRIPDGTNGESVLDNSLVVITSDMGEQRGHGSQDTGFILAGNLGGGTGGRHLRLAEAGNYHDTHVLVSIANMFDVRNASGAPLTEFGLRGFAQGNVPDI